MNTSSKMPIEALIFLGVIAGFVVLLVIFFLYLNKKLCFAECGGFSCMENRRRKASDKKKILGSEDQDTSSDDSEDEIFERFKQSRKASIARRSLTKADFPSAKVLGRIPEDGSSSVEGVSLQHSGSQASGDNVHDPESFSLPGSLTGQASGGSGGSPGDKDEDSYEICDVEEQGEFPMVARYGSLEVSFEYVAEQNRMIVTVHQGRDVPGKENGDAIHTQVRLVLLPSKKQKHKTKIQPGKDPEFQEQFEFKVPVKDVGSMGIRFRLYCCERRRREQIIGEAITEFSSLPQHDKSSIWVILQPKGSLGHGESKFDVSTLSHVADVPHIGTPGLPELLLGLLYSQTTGRLSVEIIKGSNFRSIATGKAPDSFVRLTLMSQAGKEIIKCKTSTRRAQPNPIFKETFMFQVALFQLQDISLMVSVYSKRSMNRKETIGWLSLGYSSSGEEEVSHWNDMREHQRAQVCRWHVLLES